eukprot:m51a1_g14691 putative gtpase ypt3 (212) ;mRNA; r:103320-104558
MAEQHYDHLYKLVLVGNSGVGKSSLLRRFVDDKWDMNTISTTGVDFHAKNVKIGDEVIKAQIWDTGGQDRFKSITSTYYRGAAGVVIVYSVMDQQSFEDIGTWIANVKKTTGDDIVALLIGNKIDMEGRMVLQEQAVAYAQENKISYLETSAKDSTNVNRAFETIVNEIYSRLNTKTAAAPAPGVYERPAEIDRINLTPTPAKKIKKNGCC